MSQSWSKRDGEQILATGNLLGWQELLEEGPAKAKVLSGLFPQVDHEADS